MERIHSAKLVRPAATEALVNNPTYKHTFSLMQTHMQSHTNSRGSRITLKHEEGEIFKWRGRKRKPKENLKRICSQGRKGKEK